MLKDAATAVIAAALLTATPGLAGDFESEDFALRFSAAISRASTYSDVAGQGGASAASVRSTSINPAALAWRPLRDAQGQPLRFALSEQFTGLSFQRGTKLWANTESLNFYPTADFAMKFSSTQLRGNEARIRSGALFEFDANSYRLDLARRFDGEHTSSLGLQLSYAQTETNVSLPAGDYLVPTASGPVSLPFSKQVVADADREIFGARLGWQIALLGPDAPAAKPRDGKQTAPSVIDPRAPDRLLAGLVVDAIYEPTKKGSYSPLPDGVPASTAAVSERIAYQQALIRAGVAYRYLHAPWGTEGRHRTGYVRLDYQWGWFASRESELQVNRLYAGANFPIAPFLQLYAGANADDRGNVSWSAGVGFLMPTFAIEAAYQHDLLPEIGYEFGHADTLVISGGFAF